MVLPVNGSTHLIPGYYSFYRPRKDERLSWLTCSGWLTHISGHPSAAGRAQDRESSPATDRRSTTVPCHQRWGTGRLSAWSEMQTYMAQRMPLPLTVSCFSKIQFGFTFLVPAHPGSPGQRAVKRVCACVCGVILQKASYTETETNKYSDI